MPQTAQPQPTDSPGLDTPLAADLDALVYGASVPVRSVLRDPAPGTPARVSAIVPTRNESENVGPLLRRLGPALVPLLGEIIVVDDSDDDTPTALGRHAADCPVPVALVHRGAGRRDGGLGGAVVEGVRHAAGEWVLVLDADLQHPPEVAVGLVTVAMRHDVDVVVGTRYASSGTTQGLDGVARVAASSWATRLTKTLFPRRLATVSDPMSGLFAFRRSAVEVDALAPIGFKILLELLVRHASLRVAEVAYQMAPRHAGESKASLREGLSFLRHLARLRGHRLAGQMRAAPAGPTERWREATRMAVFGLVGLSGIVVNTAALWSLHTGLGVHHLLSAALATQVSTTYNFVLIDAVIYRRSRRGGAAGRAGRFLLMNNALLLLRLPALQLLVWAGIGVLVANALTLVALFLVRFFVSDRVIYGAAGPATPAGLATPAIPAGRDPVHRLVDPTAVEVAGPPSRKRFQYLTYRYDIAGVVRIGSQILLPELEFFRAQWLSDADVDITVRVGDVGRRGPRHRAAMTEYADRPTLRYEEHLGRIGANFRIDLGEPIAIEVGPLLARSPHVVYTNVIEALLRFVMVTRGRMLLHSACVSLDGVGVMLSALTDTGKTATILRLLRDHGGIFLSDDMTIVEADGTATCFPKPLTISAHTLRAVQARDLTPGEWRRLQVQSRLHSRGGRSMALVLSRFNVPIMGINAIVQALIPPPKYTVDRLVPCRIGRSTRVEELFVIERGAPRVAELEHGEAVRRMIQNTDDAYGFPPFRYLAPAITMAGLGYAELRERERQILTGFLGTVRGRVVASNTFGWADEIPKLLAGARLGDPSVLA